MNIGFEQVILFESDQFLHAGFLRIGFGFADANRVDIDSNAASAKILCGSDDNSSISATQIVDDVTILYVGQSQHRRNSLVSRRYIRNFGMRPVLSGAET